jgi:hypothetical protein
MLVQGKALSDTNAQHALLVSNNSEFRMFLSFMQIRYREYISKLKAESSILNRQQRISPKVIQTNDRGGEMQLVDAPMADLTVQFSLRDAEYATLGEAKRQMEKGVALRKRIFRDPATRVIPKDAPPPGYQALPTFLQTDVNKGDKSRRHLAIRSREARVEYVHDR